MVRVGSFVSSVSNLQLVRSIGQEDSALALMPVCARAHTDMCTLAHIHICCCLGLREKPSPFLPWRALFAYTPAFWLESARTVRSPGERPITHLNNHKENAEFPGTLAQVKLLPVSHRPLIHGVGFCSLSVQTVGIQDEYCTRSRSNSVLQNCQRSERKWIAS